MTIYHNVRLVLRTRRLIVFWLKTSRPGLYFQWLWLYLLPLAGTEAILWALHAGTFARVL